MELFDEVTDEYESVKNKQIKADKDNDKDGNKKQNKKFRGFPRRRKYFSCVPFWRFNPKAKQSWNDYISMLKYSTSRKANYRQNENLSIRAKNFPATVTVIESILSNRPKEIVDADKKKGEIKCEWIKDIIYDIIQLISRSPIYEYEKLGVRVLCHLCKVYQLYCSQNLNITTLELWDKINLNDDTKNDDKYMDILWLYELWYMQLQYFMKQPKKTWYFSPEFFELFIRKNPLIVWKLIHDALDIFDICCNSWAQSQVFMMIGNVIQYCRIEDDDDHKIINWFLKELQKKL